MTLHRNIFLEALKEALKSLLILLRDEGQKNMPLSRSLAFQVRIHANLDVVAQGIGNWAALFRLLGHLFKGRLVQPWHFAAHIQLHGRHFEAFPNLFERANSHGSNHLPTLLLLVALLLP